MSFSPSLWVTETKQLIQFLNYDGDPTSPVFGSSTTVQYLNGL